MAIVKPVLSLVSESSTIAFRVSQALGCLLLLCVVRMTSGAALAGDLENPSVIEIPVSLPDGREFVTEVTVNDLRLTPPWAEADLNPPVPARRALSLAEHHKDLVLKTLEDSPKCAWELQGIVLARDTKPERWYWQIDYYGYGEGGYTGHPYTLSFIVLMNGKIVLPKDGNGHTIVPQGEGGKAKDDK